MPTAERIVSVTYKIDLSTFTPKEKLKLDFYFSYFEKMNVGIVSTLYKELNRKGIIVGKISADHMLFENILILSFKANVKKADAYIEAILNQIKHPVFKKDLFMIYQRDSTLEIASRREHLTSTIFPFIDNLFTFSYEKEDTVWDIKSYTFEDFKKKNRIALF